MQNFQERQFSKLFKIMLFLYYWVVIRRPVTFHDLHVREGRPGINLILLKLGEKPTNDRCWLLNIGNVEMNGFLIFSLTLAAKFQLIFAAQVSRCINSVTQMTGA